MRGPSDIDNPIDQSEARALELLAGVESRYHSAIARSWISSRDCHRTTGLLIAGKNVDRMESLEKSRAGRDHRLGDNVQRARHGIDNGCPGDADFRRNIAIPFADEIPRWTSRD